MAFIHASQGISHFWNTLLSIPVLPSLANPLCSLGMKPHSSFLASLFQLICGCLCTRLHHYQAQATASAGKRPPSERLDESMTLQLLRGTQDVVEFNAVRSSAHHGRTTGVHLHTVFETLVWYPATVKPGHSVHLPRASRLSANQHNHNVQTTPAYSASLG